MTALESLHECIKSFDEMTKQMEKRRLDLHNTFEQLNETSKNTLKILESWR